jgi:hypothetical protein
MMNNCKRLGSVLFLILLLTGCLYPDERRMENQAPLQVQVDAVQAAVERYQEENRVLPIHTPDFEKPLYEKYAVHFQLLTPRYMERVPGSAFEQGGVFQYVLINVDDDPEVRLIDLRTSQKVNEVQLRLNQYLSRNDWLPWSEMYDNGFFRIDYEQLRYDEEPMVESPFTKQNLPLIVFRDGRVGIDYRPDLYRLLEESDEAFGADEDLLALLVQDSLFAPVHAFPNYLKEDGTIEVRIE